MYCKVCNQVFPGSSLRCPGCGAESLSPQSVANDTVVLAADYFARHTPLPDNTPATEISMDYGMLDGQRIHIYQCERLLGRGGMGAVYLAKNQELHRFCALKILSPRRISDDVDYIARFENEGRAAAALVHANIVTTHAIGRWQEHHFLEMEFVAGRSLQHEIDTDGELGPIRSTGMAVGIANGLAAAHRLGIIHRDLKPDNILVTPAGVPKIVDFGLAKRIHSDDLRVPNLAGTPMYMAPELFEGQRASPASDVFALGVCYYQMLTGTYPFRGESISALMNAILSGDYVSVRRLNPDIPLDMAECVSLMLAYDPAGRPMDGGAASQLLQAVLGAARDLDILVYEAFHGLTSISFVQEDGGRFRVQLKLCDQRTQTVYIENSDHDAGDRLLMIYSICCEARPDFYENALRLNATINHGGVSIRDIDGRPCFVMIDTYPRATVNGEEIRRSVLEIGSHADHVEQLLTGGDVN